MGWDSKIINILRTQLTQPADSREEQNTFSDFDPYAPVRALREMVAEHEITEEGVHHSELPEHNGPGPEYTGSLKPEIHPGEKYPPIHGPYTRAGPPNCQVDQFSPSANRAGQSKHTESGVNCI